jgi:TonB family protein
MYRNTGQEAPAHKAAWREITLLLLLPCAAAVAYAQAAAPAGATAGDGAPSEAARRAAQSPYRFILQHAAPPPAAVRKPAATDKDKLEAGRKPQAPAEVPVQSAARAPLAAPAPAPAAALPVPAPESAPAASRPAEPPQTAALARPADPPPPVRRDIVPVRTDEPRLPAALLRERPNGVVRVQFDVMPDGSASAVKVVSSSNRALNRATVEAVSGWKFQPVDEVLTVETEIAYKYD